MLSKRKPLSALRSTLLLLVLLPTLGFGCKSTVPPEARRPINLNFWGVFDDEDAYAELVAKYRSVHPNISITYRKFRIEEYGRELLNAFAEDRGPDIFMVRNTSIQEWLPKITPAPATITLPYQHEEGTLKKELVYELITTRSITPSEVRRQFPDVVGRDSIISTLIDQRTGTFADKIYGLPTSIDTMVLFFNKDLMNAAGIAEPPTNWREFQTAVSKLTKLDTSGNIIQAGAAIGTSRNVERSSDILSLLMLQNGAVMVDDNGNATFDRVPPGLNTDVPPGLDAVRFYTDFASPSKEIYTYNVSQPGSLEAFTSGKSAMFFGYSYHIPTIRARAPKLNFDVTKMPQIEGNPTINFANYWLNTISKKSAEPDAAWDFTQFIANADNVASYLTVTQKPTALRSLITAQSEDPILAVFDSQLLTARSWYHGRDVVAAENAMMDLIDDILAGRFFEQPLRAVQLAVSKVNQTL